MMRVVKRFFPLSLALTLFLSFATIAAEPAVDSKIQRRYDGKIRIASMAYEKEDFATAQKAIDEAEALVPNQPATLRYRGALQFQAKNYEDARKTFLKLIDTEANSYIGYFNVSEISLMEKHYDEALGGFQRILEARPTDEICRFRVVLILALQKKFDEARRVAHDLPNPGQTAAWYFANAAIELASGNTAKGESWIRQSEVYFPPETSKSLRKTLVEQQLLKK